MSKLNSPTQFFGLLKSLGVTHGNEVRADRATVTTRIFDRMNMIYKMDSKSGSDPLEGNPLPQQESLSKQGLTPFSNPDVTESVEIESYNTLALEALVRMKLNAFRRKDQMHLIDMLDVELIDDTWPERFPAPLAARLQQLIDDLDG